MKPFLHQVASVFFREYGTKISRLAFVFPNRRAGLFFCKYLSEIAGKALFAPRILTINDLLTNMSGKQPADRIGMLFRLYHIYSEISKSEETFDEFVYWGEMLLGDFDDVDKYMANAKMLFTNVTDLRARSTTASTSYLLNRLQQSECSGRHLILKETLPTNNASLRYGKFFINYIHACVMSWLLRVRHTKA